MDYITSQYLIDKGFSKEESRKIINKARSIMEVEREDIKMKQLIKDLKDYSGVALIFAINLAVWMVAILMG